MPRTPALLLPSLFTLLLPAGASAAPAPAPAAPARASAAVSDPLLSLRAALREGREAEAPALHQRLLATKPTPPPLPLRARADVLLAQALLRLGREAEAAPLLLALLSAAQTHKDAPLTSPEIVEARVTLGRVYQQLGDRPREKAIWNGLFDDHDAERLDLKQPAVARGLGIAARYLGSYQDANDTFRDGVARARALKDSVELIRLNIEWAQLFLEKYAAGYAEQSLDEALAQLRPENPLPEEADARALLARVKIEQGEVPGATRELERALAQNGSHAAALRTRAQIQIDDEDYAAASTTLQAVLARNPADLEARGLLAGVALLGDQQAEYQRQRAEIQRRRPRSTLAQRQIAELLTTQHRYDEAVTLLEEAVREDPKDFAALSLLGSGYLRQGQDDKGLQMLQRAFRGDRFNVRTFNLLNLFEKVIPKGYVTVTVDLRRDRPGQGGLRLRLPESEKALLLPLLVPLIQTEWQELVTRYGGEPPRPLTLELYSNPEHYAVRTVGLPGLAALGVTFGRVVTGRSPAQGAFNWGVMIWHELSHVFAIHLSNSRVPRWFTEGLSEWETEHHDPDWTRRTHAELYGALRSGQLLPIEKLNAGFTRARSISGIVVAYHEAAEVMGFLVKRFGFPKIVQALRLFAKGQRAEEILPQITGQSLQALNQGFREHLAEHLAAYRGTFVLRPSEYADLEDLEKRVKEAPAEARAHGLYALGLLKGGDAKKALAEAQAAQRLDPRCLEGMIAEAEALLRGKDSTGAEAKLRALLQVQESYDARERLGEILAARAETQRAKVAATPAGTPAATPATPTTSAQPLPGEAEFQAAKRLDPDRDEPYVELARIYERAGRTDAALKEWMAAARLDVMDGGLWQKTVKKLHEHKRWAQVAEYGAGARLLSPYNGELRAQIGEALLQLGRRGEAAVELDAALAALPEPSDEEDAASLKTRREALQKLRARARP